MPDNNINTEKKVELRQKNFESYTGTGTAPIPDPKKRVLQRSVKDDELKIPDLGLKEIDEAIFYYFDNVIKPTVIQNNLQKPVPVLYGSPERWASVQKDGFYRDKNGKIQVPLIMIKRDLVEKNRNLGNKLDANNPTQFLVFQKQYSKKNRYDRFSLLNSRVPTEELQGVVMPDYVNITYSCVMFTEYIEQMNKLVEAVNYASDSYWGNPEKFHFRAMIDSYTTSTELSQGEDRTVKTNFNISLLGHVIPKGINASLQGSGKFYSKSRVIFNLETVSDINNIIKDG